MASASPFDIRAKRLARGSCVPSVGPRSRALPIGNRVTGSCRPRHLAHSGALCTACDALVRRPSNLTFSIGGWARPSGPVTRRNDMHDTRRLALGALGALLLAAAGVRAAEPPPVTPTVPAPVLAPRGKVTLQR